MVLSLSLSLSLSLRQGEITFLFLVQRYCDGIAKRGTQSVILLAANYVISLLIGPPGNNNTVIRLDPISFLIDQSEER